MRAVAPIGVATPSGVRAYFTTRAGGDGEGGSAGLDLGTTSGPQRRAVRDNRRLLCGALGIDPAAVVLGQQVHGTAVRIVDRPGRGRFDGELVGWESHDGMVTSATGVPLLVLGADCLPVLAWRRDGGAVGAAHAGWRGLVDGVLGRLVGALGAPGEVAACIGPGAGPCCYEVDDALRRRFRERFGPAVVRGRNVDLAAAARVDLAAAGVAADAVATVRACTICEPTRFFSHRRDGTAAGRQGGVIWREEGA